MTSKRVAVVTGGNKGIGLAIVRGLASKFDGDVLLTARNEGRGRNAVKVLADEGATNVSFHQLDIDKMASIEKLAAFLKSEYGGIDVLVNNAAINFKRDATDQFGHQAKVTVATNYFSVKNTCAALFPLLRSGARVVNVSSLRGFLPNIPGQELRARFASSASTLTVEELDQMMDDFVASAEAGDHAKKGWPDSTYVVSKVGLSALSRIQQREVDADKSRSDIAVNHVHPGYVDTDMTSHKGPLTPDEGAKSSIFAATLPANTEIRGKYLWCDCQVVDWVDGPMPVST